MNKYASRNHFATKRSRSGPRLRWLLLLVVLVVLSSGVIFFVRYHKSAEISATFSSLYSKMTTWIAERRGHRVKKAVNEKQVAVNQEAAEPQIHFEFYTALPKMQIGRLSSLKKEMKVPSVNNKIAIADANELEQELSNAVKEAR